MPDIDNIAVVTTLNPALARLAAFAPTTFPVLSVYLNTAPDPHGRPPDLAPYLHREGKALAQTWAPGSPERDSFDHDLERIVAFTAGNLPAGALGAAIFACAGEHEFFESIPLDVPVGDHRVYAYNQPHLFHLTHLDHSTPRYAAVLTDMNTARIFVFGLGHEIEVEAVKGKKVHRVKVGGWSQARYQRRVGNAHQEHAKEVIEHLSRIVHDDHISHIVLAGDSAVLSLLEGQLPKELVPMTQVMKLDVHASGDAVLNATLAVLQKQVTQTAAEKVGRLLDLFRARGLAIVGLDATLAALAQGQVDELLISAAFETIHPQLEPVAATVAPELPDAAGQTQGQAPRAAMLPDLLVTKARQTNAAVTFVEDPALLAAVDGVGAFLRWRD